MNNVLVKNLKKNYNVLWPSFFAVAVFLFGIFIGFVSNWMIEWGVDEELYYLTFSIFALLIFFLLGFFLQYKFIL